jgi:hypothetical protein
LPHTDVVRSSFICHVAPPTNGCQLKSPYFRTPCDGLRYFSCRVLVVHINSTRARELISHRPESPMRLKVKHTTGCCPVPRMFFLLSPPQCHEAFGTMPHTLTSVDQNPVCRPRTFHPPRGRLWLGFGRVVYIYKQSLSICRLLQTGLQISSLV